MNFDEAIATHVQWKLRLRSCIDGHEILDAADIRPDDRCTLGKWIHFEATSQVTSAPEFTTLRDRHAAFHRTAAEIVERCQAGKKTEAATMLDDIDGAYTHASTAVVSAIRAMRHVVSPAG